MKTITKVTTAVLSLAAAATGASAMFGGTVVAQPPTTGMVAININGVACTGTLVSPHWVLTARHCLEPRNRAFGGDGLVAEDLLADASVRWPRAVTRDRTLIRYVAVGAEDRGGGEHWPMLWAFDDQGAPKLIAGDAGGQAVFDLAGAGNSELTAVTTTSSGDIIAAGWAEQGGLLRMLVMRFDLRGVAKMAPYPLDPPPEGFALGYGPAPLGTAAALALDGVGNVVVVGSHVDRGVERWVAEMFDAAGQRRPMFEYLETTFEHGRLTNVAIVGGKVVVSGMRDGQPVVALLGATAVESVRVLGGGMSEARGLAVDSAQRIVVAGRDAARSRVVVARYTLGAALTADATFDGDGVAVRDNEDPDQKAEVVGVEVAPGDAVMVGVGLTSSMPTTMTAVRFTSAGRPDPAFGQDGLIDWSVNGNALEAAGLAVGDGVVVLVGHSAAQAGVAAVAYDLAYNPVQPSDTVKLGGLVGQVRRAVVHHDASIDAALLELDADLVDAAQVRFGGFADPESLMPGATVVCYGAGADGPGDDAATGTLRRGLMTFDELADGNMLTLTSICPKGLAQCDAVLLGGDSGTACFVSDNGVTWQQLGVYRGSYDLAPGSKKFEPGSLRHQMTRGDVIADWVEREATP